MVIAICLYSTRCTRRLARRGRRRARNAAAAPFVTRFDRLIKLPGVCSQETIILGLQPRGLHLAGTTVCSPILSHSSLRHLRVGAGHADVSQRPGPLRGVLRRGSAQTERGQVDLSHPRRGGLVAGRGGRRGLRGQQRRQPVRHRPADRSAEVDLCHGGADQLIAGRGSWPGLLQ